MQINTQVLSWMYLIEKRLNERNRHKKRSLFARSFGCFVVNIVLIFFISQNRGVFLLLFDYIHEIMWVVAVKLWLFKVFLVFIFSLLNIYERTDLPIERSTGTTTDNHIYNTTDRYVLNSSVRPNHIHVCDVKRTRKQWNV